MSKIFDALQRSEATRTSDTAGEPLKATDVLRDAERLAATKWKETARPMRKDLAEIADKVRAIDQMAGRDNAAKNSVQEIEETAAAGDRLMVLSQFKPISYTLSPTNRLIAYNDKDSAAAEAFRLLGVRIRDIRRSRSMKKILITSTIPQEGKSMVSGNLAVTLASSQQNVLLLEGDVRRPALTESFGLSGNSGLCEWLQGERSLMSSIYHMKEPNIWIMPAGNSPANPLEILQAGKLSALMSQLEEWFDTIIVDSPPVLPLADTSVWMRLVDGVLLVSREGKTEKRQLKRGLEAIDQQKLIGAILNSSKAIPHSDYYYRTSGKTAN